MQNQPSCPKIIPANKIAGHRIELRNVSIDDAEFIISLRQNKNKSRYISKTDSSVESQKKWIESYLLGEGQAYFIMEDKNNKKIGTIRAYDQQGDSFCWGSWITSPSAPDHASIESALILYSFMMELGFKNSHFSVRKENTSVRKFHERFGAKINNENEQDVFYTINENEIKKSLIRYRKILPDGIAINY